MKALWERYSRVFDLLGMFLISRAVIFVAGYYSNIRVEKFHYFRKQGHWSDPFFQWDSYWYQGIIRRGYHYVEGEPSSVHFFPLYPMLLKGLSWITGEWVVTGFVVSNICLFLAVVYLDKLVSLDFERKVADRAVLFMLLFPTGFFLSLFYPESLYLFLSIAAVYHARQRQWLLASLFGFFLALSKTPGVFIAAVLGLEYLRINYGSWRIQWREIRFDILWLGLVPLGLGLYMLYLHLAFGDAMAFSKATASWNREFVFFVETFRNNAKYPPFEQILYIGTVVLALATLIYGLMVKVRFSYLVYAAMLLFLFCSANVLESIQRHALMLFPMYIALAHMGARNRHVDLFITTFSVMLLTLFTVLFVAGYRMY